MEIAMPPFLGLDANLPNVKGGFFVRKLDSYPDKLRTLVMVGLFVAMGIVLQVFSIQMPLMRISIAPIPTVVSGLLLGPVLGGITGLIKDVTAFMVAPPAQGSFFPPITIIQMLYGILPPLLLPVFRKPVDWVWGKVVQPESIQSSGRRWLAGLPARLITCYLVVAATQFITGWLLMPAALSILLNKQLTAASWLGIFTSRIPQQIISRIGYPALTYPIIEALDRVPARMRFRDAALSRHS